LTGGIVVLSVIPSITGGAIDVDKAGEAGHHTGIAGVISGVDILS